MKRVRARRSNVLDFGAEAFARPTLSHQALLAQKKCFPSAPGAMLLARCQHA